MTEEKINVDVYNWGPCVVRVKIKDDLVKTLLKEGKNNRLDFRDKLAFTCCEAPFPPPDRDWETWV